MDFSPNLAKYWSEPLDLPGFIKSGYRILPSNEEIFIDPPVILPKIWKYEARAIYRYRFRDTEAPDNCGDDVYSMLADAEFEIKLSSQDDLISRLTKLRRNYQTRFPQYAFID